MTRHGSSGRHGTPCRPDRRRTNRQRRPAEGSPASRRSPLAKLVEAETSAASAFERDRQRTFVIGVDEVTCQRAAELGAVTGARSLDAWHLAAAERAGGRSPPIVTFDIPLGRAAWSLGFTVIGV